MKGSTGLLFVYLRTSKTKKETYLVVFLECICTCTCIRSAKDEFLCSLLKLCKTCLDTHTMITYMLFRTLASPSNFTVSFPGTKELLTM